MTDFPEQKLPYRPDIDGLRAIAILAVLFFHTGMLPAGYVGVDVFFVISGYLITSLIWKEIEQNIFSFGQFYARRVRRLVPALLFVVAATNIAAYKYLPPIDLKAYAKSLGAFLVFASNWNFLAESGYFSAAAETKPLLHTWSLSVEEQFYLIFPVLLLALYKLNSRKKVVSLFVVLFAASLILQQTLMQVDDAFYNSFARFWELLAGATLTIMEKDIKPNGAITSFSGIAGLLLVFAVIPLQEIHGNISGLLMTIPVMGAVLLLYRGNKDACIVYKVLSVPPFVFIGKISYALYLWHWPAIVFITRLSLIHKSHAFLTVAALVFSFLMATLSYYFVEMPIRQRRIWPRKKSMAYLFVAFLGLFCLWLWLPMSRTVCPGALLRNWTSLNMMARCLLWRIVWILKSSMLQIWTR